MKMFRKLTLSAALAVAVLGLTATQAAAWDVEPPVETEFEVKDGGAHCQNGPLGNHWRWDVRVIPGDAVVGTPTISAPWEIVHVDGPNANNRLILHAISYDPDPSGTATVTVNGEGYEVTPTMHYNGFCPTPPPVEVTVCRDGEIITIPEDQVLPTDTEECPTVPPVEPPVEPPVDNPPVPETPELVPPVTEFNPPAAVPSTPTAQVDTPAELAFTGAAETAALVAAGLSALIAGFALHFRGNKAHRGLLG